VPIPHDAADELHFEGKKQPLVLWKRVKPPGPDFTGIRPWSSGQKMYNNVYFVLR
jgi:hypothetical protein